ncbi:MAG: CsiV family protein [Gammaproteobacteria bacterium]|nr:MAG: CsiV family protein [Gammaproteobacteria bacterium]
MTLMTVVNAARSCAVRWRHRGHRGAAVTALALVFLAAGLLTGATALAQEPPAAIDGAPLYQVELVVFRAIGPRAATRETLPPADLPAPAMGTDADATVGEPLAGPPSVPAAPALATADLRLAGIAARLRQSPDYQLVYHGGWLQPVQPRQRATAILLAAQAAAPGLGGSITVYRERFLHALLDVTLGTGTTQARLQQSRRLRDATPQYFDHPVFGVILSVRPSAAVTAPAPGGAADEESAGER